MLCLAFICDAKAEVEAKKTLYFSLHVGSSEGMAIDASPNYLLPKNPAKKTGNK